MFKNAKSKLCNLHALVSLSLMNYICTHFVIKKSTLG